MQPSNNKRATPKRVKPSKAAKSEKQPASKSDRLKLPVEAQRRIVIMLACYVKTPVVISTIREEFKIEIERQNVNHYNVDNNDTLAEEWKALFAEARKRYLENAAQFGISQLVYRLQLYQELYEGANGPSMRLQVLEQVAREMGDQFTNKQKIESKVSGEVVQMSLEEWNQRSEERRRQAEEALRMAAESEEATGD